MKRLLIAAAAAGVVGCATLTEDAMTPIALSFSDGSNGTCNLMNKRGAWPTPMPAVVSVRKSDDALKYDCATDDGRKAFGSITSEMGGKIVASAVFLDLGITDAITDKHRKYADSFVIPMPRVTTAMENAKPATAPVAPATEPVAPATEPVAPATEPVAPATEPVAPATEPVAPATEPVAPATEPVAPATD